MSDPSLHAPCPNGDRLAQRERVSSADPGPALAASPSSASVLARTPRQGQSRSCTVCGDAANWHSHYGAIACTSCRAFFRRAILTKAEFTCIFAKEACPIDRLTRKRCQFCRLKRCRDVGMKPEWIVGEKKRKKSSAADVDDAEPAAVAVPATNNESGGPYPSSSSSSSLVLAPAATASGLDLTAESDSLVWDESLLDVINSFPDTSQPPCTSYLSLITYYSSMVGKAISMAQHFPDFALLSEDDQRILLLHNADPVVQICTRNGIVPPWFQDNPGFVHEHRVLQNEMNMLRPDQACKLMVSLIALLTVKFCDGLAERTRVDALRQQRAQLFLKHLRQKEGAASGTETYSKWGRILHCLQTQAEEAKSKKLMLSNEKE